MNREREPFETTSSDGERFDFAFVTRYRLPLWLIGVRPTTAYGRS